MPNSKISRTTPETQAKSDWHPPTGTLGELIAAAILRAGEIRGVSRLDGPSEVAPFEASIRRQTVAVIAEVKRSSPSKGIINPGMDSGAQARAYTSGGAAAVSVLTEPTRFSGSLEDIQAVRSATDLPILRKDFLVAGEQLIEARNAGASAALIIVRAIEPHRLHHLSEVAGEIGLELLFEIRNEAELELALHAGARIIGVNNRNLETLEVDPGTVGRLVPRIPPDCTAIAESGYVSVSDVERAALAGADAVLIGSAFSSSPDPEQAVRNVANVMKRGRD